MLDNVEILDNGQALGLGWQDGSTTRFHAIWLRDNAQDAETRAPGNGQRLINVLQIAEDLSLAAASITPQGDLLVTFAPEGKEIAFSAPWLAKHIYDRPKAKTQGWADQSIDLWGQTLGDRLPRADFTDASDQLEVKLQWLAGFRRYGIAIMSGVPLVEGSVCEVAELFGHVRETNYGRQFDVRAEVNPVNLAYTNLGLQAHTDNPYRDPVPTLQLLACLENTVEGGESIIVDGFHAANLLLAEAPEAFDLLS